MPIVDPVPPAPVVPVSNVQASPLPYRGVVVDSKYTPATALLTHLEGSSWTVNYYSQVLGADSALSGQQVTKNAIYQQYKLVEKLELKVTAALTANQDNTTKALTITGSATVYPCITPNEGDMFIADIGDGNTGIFRVTLSERKSIFKDTAHAIEYQMVDYSSPEKIGDLNAKVIDTLVFVKEFLQTGQNPLLHNNDYILATELRSQYFSLLHRYFKSFVSNEFKTLIVPGQGVGVYDPYLTKAVMSFFSAYDAAEIRNVRILNVDDDEAMKATTIWDMLKNKDRRMHKYCIRQSTLVSAKTFALDPMMEGIYHSGISYVVYPLDPILSVDYGVFNLIKVSSGQSLLDTPSPITNLADLIGGTAANGLTLPDRPLINKVLVDDYYVLSQAFYDQDPTNQSVLELCINNYLDGKAQDNAALVSLAKTSHAWNGLERFYYTIILLVLIKDSISLI